MSSDIILHIQDKEEINMFDFFWTRTASLWLSILYIILGIPLLFFPTMSLTLFIWFLSGGLAIYGVSHLWRYLSGKKEGFYQTSDCIIGIIFLLLGLFCFLFAKAILSILPLILGIILLIDGIGKLPIFFEIKQQKIPLPKPIIFGTFLPLLFGIILIANPFSTVKFVIMFFGVSLILDGGCDLITVLQNRSK